MCTIDLPCGGQMRLTMLIDNRLTGTSKRMFQCMNGHILEDAKIELITYKPTTIGTDSMFFPCKK